MDARRNREEFDKKVRLHVYDQFIQQGRPPSVAQAAEALSSTRQQIESAYRRLADARALVLQGNGEVLMAEPFSAVPTPFVVKVGRRSCWANCVWDALGVPAMLKRDARILTSCGCCGDSLMLEVRGGLLLEASGIVHFGVPAEDWWRNVAFT